MKRKFKEGGDWKNPQATIDTPKQGVSVGTKSSAKLTKAEKEDAKKKMDRTVDITRKATAIGSLIPIPIIQYPSIAINSALGAYDVYEDVKEGNYRQAVIDGVTAVPLPYISSAGYVPKIAAKLNRYNSATTGVNAVGAVDDWGGLQQQAMGGKIKRKKMASGGITNDERMAWEKMQGAAYQQGYYGNDHSKQPGEDFMRQYGVDPSRLGAYQQDFLDMQGANPIKGRPQVRATHGGFSPADSHYGTLTSGQRYTHYQIDDNGKLSDYGTDFNAFKTNSDAIQARQDSEWAGFGDPTKNINYVAPQTEVVTPKATGLAATGFPTREEAISRARAKGTIAPSDGTWDNGQSQYSVDRVREQENYDMAKGGKVKRRLKKMGTGDLVSDNPIGGATQLNVPPTGTGPQGDGRWDPVPTPPPPPTPQPPVQEAPQPEQKEIVDVRRKKEFNVGLDLNLNTAGLISAADALVTNNIYNPQMRAFEANRQRAAQMRPTNNNNYIGGDMLTYARGGQVVDDYTMHPAFAKEEIEGGEMVRLPNGQTDMASGPKHYEGGIPTNLPEGTEVYSAQMYADKHFVSDITGGKSKRRMKIADLANKFSTKKEEGLMKEKMDPIRERSLKATMDYKQTNLDQIFAYQEMMKNPEESVRGMMKMGGKKRCYAPGGLINVPPGPSETWEDAHPSGDYPIPGMVMLNENQPLSPENPIPGAVNMPAMAQRDILSPAYPTNDAPVYMDAPTDNSYERLVPYAGNRVTPPVKDTKTVTKTVKGKKKVFSLNEVGVSGMVPGAMAAINAITEHPIPLNLYQPQYAGRPEELNIDPILNRNLAQARALMTGNSGNRSVDQARALQALASVQNADTEAYGNKFNFDGQAKTAWRNKVADTNNQAQLYNLSQLDKMGDKRDVRQANKDAAFQAIANNAYTNSRKRLYDKHAQTLAQQFSPSYHYDPSTGFTYVEGADGQFHYVPIGQQSGLYNSNDGVRVTETTTTKNGKTQKRRSVKEDKNA